MDRHRVCIVLTVVALLCGSADAQNVSEATAASRLTLLQRSAERESDPARIIQRYETFVRQHRGTDAARQAEVELAIWRERRDNGHVRVRDRWLDGAALQAQFEKDLLTIDAIRSAMDQSLYAPAAQLLVQALTDQPDNVSFQYLDGVLSLRAGDTNTARRRFGQVLQLLPDHAPSLNNVAVILVKQNRLIPAADSLEKAMRAAPGRAELIDNAVELVTLASGESRNTTLTRFRRTLEPQELALQQQRDEQGLFRWGSGWVDRATLDSLRAAELAFAQRVLEVDRQFNEAQQRIGRNQESIRLSENLMRRIEQASYVRDSQGNIRRLPLPDSYWQAERDVQQYEQRIAEDVRAQEDLRAQLASLEKERPKPSFRGSLTPVGPEGVPLMPWPGVAMPVAPEPDPAPEPLLPESDDADPASQP
jgi:tetratricopeptide (TPR) repeat protein